MVLLLAVALGAFDPTVTAAQVCTPGYARAHRHVPRDVRDRVYAAAGIPRGQRRGWTLDHVIPLELAGTNDVANLAPQPRAEAKAKDRDENALHAAVCSGRMTLAGAARGDPAAVAAVAGQPVAPNRPITRGAYRARGVPSPRSTREYLSNSHMQFETLFRSSKIVGVSARTPSARSRSRSP
ncbi:MAG: hypothetical protein JWM87_781 [Candidatus Eremiobacteraeota bacterium]|nr:hypothetical protein [Candidatus Eremiobacteraeota bacterium]